MRRISLFSVIFFLQSPAIAQSDVATDVSTSSTEQSIDCILKNFKEEAYATFALPTDRNLVTVENTKQQERAVALVKLLAAQCKTKQQWSDRQYISSLFVSISTFKLAKRKEELLQENLSLGLIDRIYKRLTPADIQTFLQGKIPSSYNAILVEEFTAEGIKTSDDGELIDGKSIEESYIIGQYIGGYIGNKFMVHEFRKTFSDDEHKTPVLVDFFKTQGLDLADFDI